MKSKKQIYSQGGTIFDNPNFVAQGISTGANLTATAIDTFVEDEKERVNPVKDMATGALRMGGQGASIGTMVAPGIGTAIGGGLGLLIGGATAYNNSQNQAKEINDNIMDSRYGEKNKDKYFPWSGGTLFAEGGNLDPTVIQGSTHEEGGVSLSPQVEVEKDEVVWNKYVFSNRILNPKTNQTFADDAKKIMGKYKERDNDSYSDKSLNKEMEALRVVHEVEKMKIEQDRLAKEQQSLDQVNRYGDSIGDDLQVNNPQMKEELIQMAMGGGIPYDSLVKDIYSNKIKYRDGGPLRPEERVNLGVEQSQINPLFFQGYPRFNKLDGATDSPLVDNLGFVDYSKPDPNQPFSFNRINLPKENIVPIKSFTGSHNETTIGYPEGQSIGREDLYRTTLQPKSINLMGNITNNSRRLFDGATANDLPATNTQTSANNIVDPRASKSTFGNEEAALLASSAAGLDNLIKSFNPETTSFDRVNLERLNLEKIREQNRRNSDRSFNQFGQSIRGSGLSSGEVLSGLATGSSSVSQQRMEGDLSTYLQEEQANTQISNQESQLNNQISREETIANEQNRAAAKSAGNLALSDLGTNAQGYMRDKKMGAENLRYNEQVKDLINQFFPNYKFGTNPSTDKILAEFVNNYKPNK